MCGRRRDPPCSRLLFCHGIATNLVRYSRRPAHFPHPGGLERASPPTRGALSFCVFGDVHLIRALCSGSLRRPAARAPRWAFAKSGDRRSGLRGALRDPTNSQPFSYEGSIPYPKDVFSWPTEAIPRALSSRWRSATLDQTQDAERI